MGGRQGRIKARRCSPSTSSASTFGIQGVTTGGLHTEVIPSRPPKQTYQTQETKYCRPIENKRNSLTPSGGNVAFPELLTYRPPRWGLHSWASKRKRPAIAQPHQGLIMVPLGQNPWRSPLSLFPPCIQVCCCVCYLADQPIRPRPTASNHGSPPPSCV